MKECICTMQKSYALHVKMTGGRAGTGVNLSSLAAAGSHIIRIAQSGFPI
jgi:hypothetical protein